MTRLRLVAVPACLLASAALAYVLPGSSVIRRMADARDDLHLAALRVDGTAAFADQAQMKAADALGIPPEAGELRTDAVFSFKLPGRCRVDLLNAEESRAAVINVHGRTRVEGTELPSVRAALEEVCALVTIHARGGELQDVFAHLRSLGVDTEKIALGRFGGQMVYAIGDAEGTGPRFDVYKGSFMPARIRWAREGETWEVRFLDYGGPITGEWFPRVIEVVRGDQVQLRFASLRADSRPRLSDKLFTP